MNSYFFALIFLLLLCSTVKSQTPTRYTQNQVAEDLDYLYESLKDAHYNVYAYIREQEFDSAYAMARNSIKKDSINLLEATNIFQRLTSSVNNGHTEIPFPGQSYGEYAYAGGTLFPLEIGLLRSTKKRPWRIARDAAGMRCVVFACHTQAVGEAFDRSQTHYQDTRRFWMRLRKKVGTSRSSGS